jgi:hypothetical protein
VSRELEAVKKERDDALSAARVGKPAREEAPDSDDG